MKVNEIFSSIEGEGKRAGLPCVFIRLHGCNLNCSYCDTRYSCDGEEYEIHSVEDILARVKEISLGCRNVTVTGGEPLIHSGIAKLLQALVDNGYHVNVETNGTEPPAPIEIKPSGWKSVDLRHIVPEPDYDETCGSIFYTMDWKCKSSGMEDKMDIHNVNALTDKDVLKFVVGSEEDMNGALQVIEQMTSKPQVFFSPVFGKIEPVQIVDYLQKHRLYDCRVQLQLHKLIWSPDQRGV